MLLKIERMLEVFKYFLFNVIAYFFLGEIKGVKSPSGNASRRTAEDSALSLKSSLLEYLYTIGGK